MPFAGRCSAGWTFEGGASAAPSQTATAAGLNRARAVGTSGCDLRDDEVVSRERLPGETRAYLVYGFRQQGNQRINHIASEVMVLKP